MGYIDQLIAGLRQVLRSPNLSADDTAAICDALEFLENHREIEEALGA